MLRATLAQKPIGSAERAAVAGELKGLVQSSLTSRMESLMAHQAAAAQAEAAAEAAASRHEQEQSSESKEALDLAKKEAVAARKQGNCMVGAAGVLNLLAENAQAFEQGQLSTSIAGILDVIGNSTVTDAANWAWVDGELPDFNSVFDKLGRVCISPEDKVIDRSRGIVV